jgi:hypothetical protein
MHAAAGHSSRNISRIIDFAITRVDKGAFGAVPPSKKGGLASLSPPHRLQAIRPVKKPF